MALKYYLVDNPVSPDPTDKMAVSKPDHVYSLENLIDLMIDRGSTVTKAEALSVIEELSQAIGKVVADGNWVSTPLFAISSHISGVFTSEEDRFDSSRHNLKLRVKAGKRLAGLKSKIKVKKIRSQERYPRLRHFLDMATGEVNSIITSGATGQIKGEWLKFDKDDLRQGIFFIHKPTARVIRVSSGILENKPGKLMFSIPSLDPGHYRVEVRTILRQAKSLKTGIFPTDLIVR